MNKKNKTIKSKVEKKIKFILNKIRPYVQMHGGDVELSYFDSGTVCLNISGACIECNLADLTYKKIIGQVLKSEIPEIVNIVLDAKIKVGAGKKNKKINKK